MYEELTQYSEEKLFGGNRSIEDGDPLFVHCIRMSSIPDQGVTQASIATEISVHQSCNVPRTHLILYVYMHAYTTSIPISIS